MTTPSQTENSMDSVRAFFAGLIDYAGLFPPAELAMADAVANYAAYRRDANSWLLARFILPIARLAEFETALSAQSTAHPTDHDAGDAPWRLSALVAAQPERLAADLAQIARFNAHHAALEDGAPAAGVASQSRAVRAVIETIETKAQTADEIAGIAQTLKTRRDLSPDLVAYVELPLGAETDALIARLASVGLRAKVRTGGVTADAFPRAEELAAFLAACAQKTLPFKATAGLHHAIRATYRLTYAPDSPSAPMYGFLNVFLAAAWLADGATREDAIRILGETDPAAFQFDVDGVTWRGRRLTTEQLAQTRQLVAISYGSCSFEEPVEHLKAMGLV